MVGALTIFVTILLCDMALSSRREVALLFINSLVRRRTRVSTTHMSRKGCSCSSYFSLVGRRVSRTSLTVKGLRIALKNEPCQNCPVFDTPSRCLRTVGSTKFSVLLATGGRYLSHKGGKVRHAVRLLSSSNVHCTNACGGLSRHERHCPLFVGEGNFHVTLLGCACNAGNVGTASPGVMGCVSGGAVLRSVRDTGTHRPSTVVTYVR